jgi:hypothetical protein
MRLLILICLLSKTWEVTEARTVVVERIIGWFKAVLLVKNVINLVGMTTNEGHEMHTEFLFEIIKDRDHMRDVCQKMLLR